MISVITDYADKVNVAVTRNLLGTERIASIISNKNDVIVIEQEI